MFRSRMRLGYCVVVALLSLSWVLLSCSVRCQRPSSVNIGAIFTFNSVIGRVAKTAIEAAVSDINDDPTILKGIQLRLITEDANSSVFLGSVEGNSVLILFYCILFENSFQ